MDEETLTVWLDTALLMLGGFVLMAVLMISVMNPPTQSGPAPLSSRATSLSGSTASTPSTWLAVIPCLRQCAPPELKARLPPIVHTDWLEGSGA